MVDQNKKRWQSDWVWHTTLYWIICRENHRINPNEVHEIEADLKTETKYYSSTEIEIKNGSIKFTLLLVSKPVEFIIKQVYYTTITTIW